MGTSRDGRDRRSTYCEVNLLRPGFSSHDDNLPARRTSHDAVVHQKDIFASKFILHRIQFPSHSQYPFFLARHNEGAVYVPALDETLAKRFLEPGSNARGRRIRGFRNRNDNINLFEFLRRQHFSNLRSQLITHVFSALIDADAINDRVRSCKVHVLEDVGSVASLLLDLEKSRG